MSTWAKAIIDWYVVFWWQLYSGALALGIVVSLALSALRRPKPLRRCASAIRVLLYLSVVADFIALGLTVVHQHDSPWVFVCFLIVREVGFFFVGVLIAFVISLWVVSAPRSRGLSGLLMNEQTIRAARSAVAAFYITAGATKFLASETLDFFHASGYSTAFFYMIAAWELAWGVGLMRRGVALPAAFALCVDMLGAIYTHYHNYFVYAVPDPFANSLDALRMLCLLAYIAGALKSQQRAQSLSAGSP